MMDFFTLMILTHQENPPHSPHNFNHFSDNIKRRDVLHQDQDSGKTVGSTTDRRLNSYCSTAPISNAPALALGFP